MEVWSEGELWKNRLWKSIMEVWRDAEWKIYGKNTEVSCGDLVDYSVRSMKKREKKREGKPVGHSSTL